jgi:3-oxoacyl-[acyl-carrier protein] reductase
VSGDLAGRVTLVTGAARGVGEATARRLAADGARVVLADVRDELGAAVAEDLGPVGRYEHLDVTDESAWRRVVDGIGGLEGRLDVLVNNAGTTKFIDHKNLDALTDEVWDRIIAVNVKGTFFVSRAAAKVMTEGRIINIGSVGGINGAGSSIPYAASKAAIHVLTRSLARVLAPRITVNTIAPGLIETRWHAGNEAKNAARVPTFPAKRIGRPEDVAQMALAFATADNFVTGQVMVVDGGATISFSLGPQ